MVDPVLWNAIQRLTQTLTEREGKGLHTKSQDFIQVKQLRQLIILCCIMYCTDSKCSTPLHLPLVDMIDCFGSSTDLIQILNRLGVCSSMDTLLRHIQQTVELSRSKGLLQDLATSKFTVFSVDNIDFLHSHAQVFCGNQHLSWHGTTIQAVQPHVSPQLESNVHETMQTGLPCLSFPCNNRLSDCLHDSTDLHLNIPSQHTYSNESMVVSPIHKTPPRSSRRRKMNTPTKPLSTKPLSTFMHSPLRKKKCPRARTGTENETVTIETEMPPIHTPPLHQELTNTIDVTLAAFQLNAMETELMNSFRKEVTYYLLLKNAHKPIHNHIVGIQEYFAITSNIQALEAASVVCCN